MSLHDSASDGCNCSGGDEVNVDVNLDTNIDADATTSITPTHCNINANINTDQPTPKSLPQPPPSPSSMIVKYPITPSFFGNVMKRSTQSEPHKAHSFNPTLQRSISSFFSSPLSQPPVIQNLSFDGEDQEQGPVQEQDNASNRWTLPRQPRGRIMMNHEKIWNRFADTTDNPSSMIAADKKSISISSSSRRIPESKIPTTNQAIINSNNHGDRHSTLGCTLKQPSPGRSKNVPPQRINNVERNNIELMLSTSNSCDTTIITTSAATPLDQVHISLSSDPISTSTQIQQTRRTLLEQSHNKPPSTFLTHGRSHTKVSDIKTKLSTLRNIDSSNGSSSKQMRVEGKDKRETEVPPPSPSTSPLLLKIKHNAIPTSMGMASPPDRRLPTQDTNTTFPSTPPPLSSPSRRTKRRILSPEKLDWDPATPERPRSSSRSTNTTTTTTIANATSLLSQKAIVTSTSPSSRKNSALSYSGVSDCNHPSTPDDGQRRRRQQRRLQDQRHLASGTTPNLTPPKHESMGTKHKNDDEDGNTVNWHPSTPQICDSDNVFFTPKKNNSFGSPNSLKTAQSPGGFALLQILDSCKNDGWNHHYNHKNKTTYPEDDDVDDVKLVGHTKKSTKDDENATIVTNSKLSSSSQGGGDDTLEDWEEAWIRLPSLKEDCNTLNRYHADDCDRENNNSPLYSPLGEVGIVDWSIKRCVRIECHPNCCQPGLHVGQVVDDDNDGREVGPSSGRRYNKDSSSCGSNTSWGWDSIATSISDQTQVEHLAMRLLKDPNPPPTTLDSVSEDMMIRAQWEAGLMYWQHPSVHPLPPSLLNKNSSTMVERVSRSGIKPMKTRGKHSFSSIPSSAPMNTLLKRQSSLPTSYYSKQNQQRAYVSHLQHGKINIIHDPSYSRSALSSSTISTNNTHLLEKLEHYAIQDRSRTRAGLGCLGGLGRSGGVSGISRVGDENHTINNNTSSLPALLEQREREWQESFRSMFFAWMGKIQELQCQLRRYVEGGEKGVEEDGMMMQSITNKLNRVYFYSVSPEQTILFRAAISSHGGPGRCGKGSGMGNIFKGNFVTQTGNPAINNFSGKCTIVPVIIMSSSTPKMRSILRSMDVKLMVDKKDWNHEYIWSSKKSTKNQQHVEFDESFIDDWLQWGKKKLNDVDDLVVSEDLEALRRENSVGAEVNVSLTQRRKTSNHTQRSLRKFPPLSLSGPDDCLAFFEFFMNTCGNRLNSRDTRLGTDESFIDVPLLLCRSIGPCKHTSLQHLCINRRSNLNHGSATNVKTMENADPFGAHPASCVDLRGPILPCSSRDLTCAVVSHLLLHKKKDYVENKSLDNRHPDGKMNDKAIGERGDAVGSHYFVMHSRPHEGEEEESLLSKAIPRPRDIGAPSSLLFNGFGAHSASLYGCTRDCSEEAVIGMTVWDVARSQTIACRRSPVSEIIR